MLLDFYGENDIMDSIMKEGKTMRKNGNTESNDNRLLESIDDDINDDIEDIGLMHAIEEGLQSNNVSREEVFTIFEENCE